MRCASSSVLWSCSSACRSFSSLVISVVFIAFLCQNRRNGGESGDFHPTPPACRTQYAPRYGASSGPGEASHRVLDGTRHRAQQPTARDARGLVDVEHVRGTLRACHLPISTPH